MKSLFYREVRSIAVVMATAIVLLSSAAEVATGMFTFGVGADQFQVDFVTIGDPGNLADTDINALPLSAGAVGYTYDIGKFEVSEDMITKYNANFGTANSLAITKNNRGANKPATSVSGTEAARFVNWLNTSTGNQAAYKFATGSGVNDDIALWTSGDAGFDASGTLPRDRA